MSKGKPIFAALFTVPGPADGLREILRRGVRAIRARLDDPYEPARHYMRGVGPKARARRAAPDREAPVHAGLT
jgi:hypothetical protein